MVEAQAVIPAANRWRGIGRFGLASVSSAGVSISHLLIQLVSIHHLDASGIGTLAFLLVIIQFGYGLSNALVSTPYTIAFNNAEEASQFLITQLSIVTVPWDDAGPFLRFSVTYEAADEAAEDALMVEAEKRLRASGLVF